jgi:hypothetical protein
MSVSGMAASIRAATESETFDLGGQSVTTITNTIHDAFSEPFTLKDMIRITFVTGAGKLGRQKYDPDAAKAVTTTLRELGFEEDRAASCVADCAGSFKSQHDTGKNLKTVVVFPKVQQQATQPEDLDIGGLSMSESMLKEGSPEAMIALSSNQIFERMVASKCPSWTQKKCLLTAIESLKSTLGDLDQKLLSGTSLSDSEQSFYDAVSLDALEAKEAFVRKETQAQVERGNLTRAELETILQQVKGRLDKLQQQIKESEDKPKKVEQLRASKLKVEEREAMLSKIQPKVPHKLRHDAEIQKLLTEMAPLLKIEEETKGRLMSVKEAQMVGRKNEILEQIAQLEESSRGWFEEESAFAARVALTHQAFTANQKLQKKAPAKSASVGASTGFKPATKFVTPGMKSGGSGAWGPKAAPKAKKSPSGVFAAMMDSDSD